MTSCLRRPESRRSPIRRPKMFRHFSGFTAPMSHPNPLRGSRGFTLIEVMVVVVILAVLAAIVVPKIMSRPDEARVVAARADLAGIVQALNLYRLDNSFYPSTEQGLQALVTAPTSAPIPSNWKRGGYLDRAAKDPWGREYQYLNPGLRGEIDVFSLAADGQAGGDGVNADIFN